MIYSPGSQVVVLKEVLGHHGRVLHPRGAVAVVIRSPRDLDHSYRVRFVDGSEDALKPDELTLLSCFKAGDLAGADQATDRADLFQHVILRCVIGSQAYGLAHEASDVDRRGIYLPPSNLHWSLYGVPDQLERNETQEAYWEIQKFLSLALKANPNVLECLYTPLIEHATPLAQELLDLRSSFLSRLVYQTYNGYVMSQFKKMQADIRNHGDVKWKHVMHLIRLLIAGITTLREGFVPVRVDEHREMLLAIRRGEIPWAETERWRLNLHAEFDRALEETKLPERPDYERANLYLLKARRTALNEEIP